MARNPLDRDDEGGGGWVGRAPGPFQDVEALSQWCADRNAWAKRLGADWWWRVTKIDTGGEKRNGVEKLEGIWAVRARAHAEGRPYIPWNPTEAEIRAINAKVRKCIDQGMSQAEFNALVDARRI